MVLDRVQHARRIDQRRPRVDRDRDTQCLGYFRPCGTVAHGGFGMHRDAAIAARGHGNSKRDQLTDFRTEKVRLLAGRAEFDIPLDGAGTELAERLHATHQLFAIFVPIKHHVGIIHNGVEWPPANKRCPSSKNRFRRQFRRI
jgi:hypothetical protein